MVVKFQPEGFHTVTPYLIVEDAAKLIDFLEQTFRGEVGTRHVLPDGKIMHAEVTLGAGATSLRERTDEFYGDRAGGVLDLWGNQWWMATHKEDVSPEAIAERAKAMAEEQGAG